MDETKQYVYGKQIFSEEDVVRINATIFKHLVMRGKFTEAEYQRLLHKRATWKEVLILFIYLHLRNEYYEIY